MIDATDLAAVLAKMAPGEFAVAFVVKGGGSQPDQVELYPSDGVPMTAGATANFLSGFLARRPIPPLLANGMQVLDEETGDPVPSATPLQHLVGWIRANANEESRRGLAELAAAAIQDPAP